MHTCDRSQIFRDGCDWLELYRSDCDWLFVYRDGSDWLFDQLHKRNVLCDWLELYRTDCDWLFEYRDGSDWLFDQLHKRNVLCNWLELYRTDCDWLFVCREGSDWLFDELRKHNVPLLIFSAGVGDVVVEAVKQRAALHDNVKVVSNFMDFDSQVLQIIFILKFSILSAILSEIFILILLVCMSLTIIGQP